MILTHETAFADPITEELECSFENDLCDFLQSSNDQFNWTLRTGQTPTLHTGPDCDPVSCENGQYLYIETTRPRSYGEMARLETPYIGGSGKRCLSFYYHMYGISTGILKVKQRSLLTGLELVLWSTSGNQGNSWHQHTVSYSALNCYKIIFEGYVGSNGVVSYKGDIAIDEIKIHLHECSGSLWFDCNFENDVCGWKNSSVANQTFQLDWRRHKGNTATPGTGPSRDRSHADGYYLYVESSRTLVGDLAHLVSPSMESSSTGYCVGFYYHMYGDKSGNLTMFIEPEGGTKQQLWKIIGDQGDSWHNQQVNISSAQASQTFKILFEAALAGSTGDIALDDFTISKSLCGS
ncbi:MAM and LDL-receptor class A domain-containing protein 1 [Elysia marginata]|uniref:MAM and LDL-receptor class A domain-containing protein 1 n=1 Tax=Elysia marginata TaxID=1093978 RepID=A0AAV4HFQ1_9GAST|nr:MAM and LDL-receptor class A domain-containing protein 1 [Elysia marginata]